MSDTVDVAVLGLGFGEAFLPSYAAHPGVGRVAVVDADPRRVEEVGERHGIVDRFTDLDAVLADDTWDAVHILAPVPSHAALTLQVLRSGRHCACAVPMALELDELAQVVEAQRASGKRYMMMETSVYGREFLLARQMLRSGELGKITHYRGFHVQNLDGFPSYWRGYPPMKYLTHALSPLLALTGTTVADVVALGSGRLDAGRTGVFDNPFPVETGLFRLAGSDVVGEVTMSFFQTARGYAEGFCVYGDARSLEWNGVDGDPLTVWELAGEVTPGGRGRPASATLVEPPDNTDLLPEPLRPLVRESGHGGSHPYLVHEFVSAVLEDRRCAIDAVVAASWTAPGICAHASAMHGGERVAVPQYSQPHPQPSPEQPVLVPESRTDKEHTS